MLLYNGIITKINEGGRNMYTYPYNVNGNVQQQLAQNRMEQLQQQYNSMFPQNNMMMQQQQGMQMQSIFQDLYRT